MSFPIFSMMGQGERGLFKTRLPPISGGRKVSPLTSDRDIFALDRSLQTYDYNIKLRTIIF